MGRAQEVLEGGGRRAAGGRLGQEILAGLVMACIGVPFCIAAGILAFSPMGAAYAAQASVAGIASGIAGGLAGSFLRRSSFVLTSPTSSTGLIQASILTGLIAALGDPALALLALPLVAVLASLGQIGFGVSGLSRIVKLAPYPVIAGFVSGIGVLIMLSQLPNVLGVQSVGGILNGPLPSFPRLAFAALIVAGILILGWRLPKVPALPVGLAGAFLIYHGARLVTPGIDLGPVVGAVDLSSWRPADLSGAIGRLLDAGDTQMWLTLLAGSLTLALVGTLDTSFALEAARSTGNIDIDQKRDLIGQGAAGVVAGATGGLFASTPLSLTGANYRAGGRTRVSTAVAALLILVGILLFPGVVFSLPLVGLAAMLITVGFNLVDKWAIGICRQAIFGSGRQDRNLIRRNAAIVLTVATATVLSKPVWGVAVGVGLSCLIFIFEMNRPIVRSAANAVRLRSKRVRSAAHEAWLAEKGEEVAVVRLQGVLFFGNADEIRTWSQGLSKTVRILIFDFRHVTDVDVSGAIALKQTCERLGKDGRLLLFSSLRNPRVAIMVEDLIGSVPICPDLDAALEKTEDGLLEALETKEHSAFEVPLEKSDFGRPLGSAEIDVLTRELRPVSFAQGDRLCGAGESSDRLWVLSRGSVSTWVTVDGTDRRLASIGPGCTVGEMGLLNRTVRSADVRADNEVHAYELTEEAFRRILSEEPKVGHAILTGIACQLSDRLRQSSEDLRLTDD